MGVAGVTGCARLACWLASCARPGQHLHAARQTLAVTDHTAWHVSTPRRPHTWWRGVPGPPDDASAAAWYCTTDPIFSARDRTDSNCFFLADATLLRSGLCRRRSASSLPWAVHGKQSSQDTTAALSFFSLWGSAVRCSQPPNPTPWHVSLLGARPSGTCRALTPQCPLRPVAQRRDSRAALRAVRLSPETGRAGRAPQHSCPDTRVHMCRER